MVPPKTLVNFTIGFTVLVLYIFLSSPVPFQPSPTNPDQQFINHFAPLYAESLPITPSQIYQFLFTPLQFCPDVYYAQYISSTNPQVTEIQPIFEHIGVDPQSVTSFNPTNLSDFQSHIQPLFQLLDKYRHNLCQVGTTTLLSFYDSIFGVDTSPFYTHPLAPTSYTPARLRDQHIAQIADKITTIYPTLIPFSPSLQTTLNKTATLQHIAPVPSIYGAKHDPIPVAFEQWDLSMQFLNLNFDHFYSSYTTFLFILHSYSKQFWTTLFSVIAPLIYVLKLFFSTPLFFLILSPVSVVLHKIRYQAQQQCKNPSNTYPQTNTITLLLKRFSLRVILKLLFFAHFGHLIIISIILNRIFTAFRHALSNLINLFRGKFSNYLRSSSSPRVEQFADTEIQVLSAFVLILLAVPFWSYSFPLLFFTILTFPITALSRVLYPDLSKCI